MLRHLHNNRSMIEIIIDRLKKVKSIDKIYICTSSEPVDDILEDIALSNNVSIYRGSADEVIERLLSVGRIENAGAIIRITGDNPLTSIEYIDQQVGMLEKEDIDYVRLIDVPLGASAEVMKYESLVKCSKLIDPGISEYLMLYMYEPDTFKCGVIKPLDGNYSNYSITVDTAIDFLRAKSILNTSHDYTRISLQDIIQVLEKHRFPGYLLSPAGKIKLPYNREIDYEDFKADMARRESKSLRIELYG